MPRSLIARRRHTQRAKRRAGVFVGMTAFPAPWWPALFSQVSQIAADAGLDDRFHAASWLLDALRTPSSALGGRTPLSMMETDEGRAHVQTLLDALREESKA